MAAQLISSFATVLLLAPEPFRREMLSQRLRAYGCAVISPNLETGGWAPQNIKPDVAIFDYEQRNERWLRELEKLGQLRQFQILVLCPAASYYGPEFELSIERLGGRVIYDPL